MLDVAPLWLASHLPHRWGDWKLHLRPSSFNVGYWLRRPRHPISPPVGEMSGRTEGGNVELNLLCPLVRNP
jgi:hypothetical protein